jgi:iron-sulfur cluster assembly protein
MITITTSAAEKVKNLLSQNNIPAAGGLRLGVRGGGCSGLSYVMEFADGARPGEEVVELGGVRFFVDEKSSAYLSGTELDYVEGVMGAGFEFRNPNVKRSCACGSSFTV